MSGVVVTLLYTDYALLQAIVRDNVGRRVDTDKWDNIEKAYWMEEAGDDDRDTELQNLDQSQTDPRNKVMYSSHARFVRYGKGGKKGRVKAKNEEQADSHDAESNSSNNTADVRFDLDGFSMKLRRDDRVEGISEDDDDLANAFKYDAILLRVESVEILTTTTTAGDMSFNLSLFRIGLFDLGDSGRLFRERYYYSLPDQGFMSAKQKSKGLRRPCPFHVLAEGYSSTKEDGDFAREGDDDGPQFVLSVDTCPASSTSGFGSLSECGLPPESKVTIARIVINYLSVNALVRPFREIADFLSCKWPVPDEEVGLPSRNAELENKLVEKVRAHNDKIVPTSAKGFQLRLVAHYPRVFFLADESDANSRALVLRG
jgi:hypothetical protein